MLVWVPSTAIHHRNMRLILQIQPRCGRDMGFKQLNETGWAKTYLIWDEATKEATLIDPVYDFMDAYTSMLESEGLTLVHAMATHTHADHITACFELQKRHGLFLRNVAFDFMLRRDSLCQRQRPDDDGLNPVHLPPCTWPHER